MPPSHLPALITEHIQRLESADPEALIAVFDEYGNYLYVSPNHELATGYTIDELLSMHLSQTLHPTDHNAAYVLRTISVFYPRPIPFSGRVITKSGAHVKISGTIQHRRSPEGTMYFVSSVRHTPSG